MQLYECCNLAANVQQEEIRVTVRRNHLWSDFSRARSDYYSPLNTIKITFSGEPAIDDGGPKREFFSGGQGQFLGIDLGLIFILLFVSSVRGLIFWMIISLQCRPPPPFY